MQRTTRGTSPSLAALLASLLLPVSSRSSTIAVPEDYPTIQAAIDAAQTADEVVVAPGRYVENLTIRDKFISLRSTSGPTNTIIDGARRGSVLSIYATPNQAASGLTQISNLTFTNGSAVLGAGILVLYGYAIIRGCSIVNNIAGTFDYGRGGGIYIANGTDVTVASNEIAYNYAGDSGGGIAIDYIPNSRVIGNIIHDNGSHAKGGGVDLGADLFSSNIVYSNWCDHAGGGVAGSALQITANTIVDNASFGARQGAGLSLDGWPVVTNNIVAGNRGIGITCSADATPLLMCNDVWGNTVSDFELRCPADTSNNISVDSGFCDPLTHHYNLRPNSPCAPPSTNDCGLIGALPVDNACQAVATIRTTWGQLMLRYR